MKTAPRNNDSTVMSIGPKISPLLHAAALTIALAMGQTIFAAPAEPVVPQILTAEGTVEVAPAVATVWHPGEPGRKLKAGDRVRTGRHSRATVRLADLSIFRLNELSTLQILEPGAKDKKPLFDLKSGSSYFFSRERPADVEIRTPVMAGAIRGTEFLLRVGEDGETRLALFDGEVELGNEQGRLVLKSGEEAVVRSGQAPSRTALINASNIIQWCLYYP